MCRSDDCINHLGLRPAWLIPTHQNSKPLLTSRYTTVTDISFNKFSGRFNNSSLSRNFIDLKQSGLSEAALHTFDGVTMECISTKRIQSVHVDIHTNKHC